MKVVWLNFIRFYMKMDQYFSKKCQCQNFNLRHRSILWSHDVPVLWSGPIAGKKLGTRLPLLLLVGQRKWKRGGNKRGQAGNKKRSGVGSAEILPHGTVPKLILSEIWRNFRRFRLNRNRTRMSTDFEFWKMVWKWLRFDPRRFYRKPKLFRQSIFRI